MRDTDRPPNSLKGLFGAVAIIIAVAAFIAALDAGMLLPAPAPAPLDFPPKSGAFTVYVTEVVDGDTVKFSWQVPDTARLHGINTPEMRGPTAEKGKAAKEWLAKKLPPGSPVTVQVHGRDKYGRRLLTIWSGDTNINQALLDAGHAVKFMEDR